jgi:hypothetical protein
MEKTEMETRKGTKKDKRKKREEKKNTSKWFKLEK